MKLFEFFERKTSGLDNLKTIAEAVKNKTSAKLKLGESYIVINNTSANCVYDLYEQARVSGNLDKFMTELSNYSGPIAENVETLAHVLARFPKEVRDFEATGELDNDLYDALFDYYSMHGEMPYGITKARTGDPFQWIADRLESELDMNPDTPMEDMFGPDETDPMPELISMGMFESKKAKPDFLDADKDGNKKEPMKKALKDKEQVEEGWDDMIKASKERAAQKKTGEKWKTHRGEAEKTATGVIHRRSYDPKTGESDDAKDDSGEPAEKRGRGRPRTRPEPDANAPKRGRGRPRKNPPKDPNAPKRGRGRPKKVREWIENLRYIAESK